MRASLLRLVEAGQGVVTREEALAGVPRHVLQSAVGSGVLVRVLPRVYVAADRVGDHDTRCRAALAFAGDQAALSHTTALRVHGLLGEGEAGTALPVHVTVGGGHHFVRQPGLALHRRQGFLAEPPLVVVRRDLAVVRTEQAVVESWGLLTGIDRRTPAIVAVRDRRTTAQRLLTVLLANPRVTGAQPMRDLFGLLDAGCHSPLEMWGHAKAFAHPSLPPSRAQVPIRLGRRMVYLDRAYEEEMVDVELDGAAYHGQPGQRERDLRRDAALARLGWLTLRFSHPRLYADPDDVRAELLDILGVRRRQFGLERRSKS